MASTDGLTELLEPLRAAPGASAVFCDFDGTLAEIVDDPAAAQPVPGAVDALSTLSRVYRAVAVVSGRGLDHLRRHLGDELDLRGLYGLESLVDGEVRVAPEAAAWRAAVARAAERARQELPAGAGVEAKGFSVTLHYRRRPDLAGRVSEWAGGEASRTGLVARPARMSVELHPPVDVDKGTALLDVVGAVGGADEVRGACFLGDDAGDLPAFDALDHLAGRGLHTVRIAVVTSESPAELADRADARVGGPVQVVEVLRALAP